MNILAEYQSYNLIFLKNELALTDIQCAACLDMFWNLLEFDPDEQKSMEIDDSTAQLGGQNEGDVKFVSDTHEDFSKLLR